MNQYNKLMLEIKANNKAFKDLQDGRKAIKVLVLSPTLQVPVQVTKLVSVNGKPSAWSWNANPKSMMPKTYLTAGVEREQAMRGDY